MKQNGNCAALIEALSDIEGKLNTIVADTENEFTGSVYAKLSKFQEALRPLLAAKKVFLTQDAMTITEENTKEKMISVTTYLMLGEASLEYGPLSMPTSEKADRANRIQKLGGAITFAKRYHLAAIFNFSAEEDDDDGADEENPGPAIQEESPRPKLEYDGLTFEEKKGLLKTLMLDPKVLDHERKMGAEALPDISEKTLMMALRDIRTLIDKRGGNSAETVKTFLKDKEIF